MRYVVFLLFLFLPVANTFSEDANNQAFKKLIANVYSETLDNGLKIIVYQRSLAPVFSGALVVRVGGVDEKVGHTGLSHLLEHMAFKGTPQIGTFDYAREKELLSQLEVLAQKNPELTFSESEQKQWDEIRAQLEKVWNVRQFDLIYSERGASGQNASTDKDLTRYFVDFPINSFEFWCWIESERILHPVMRQFYKERNVVLEERRMRYEDSPMGKLYEMLLGVAYLHHPYRNPVIGYESDIRKLTASKIEDFHKRYYVPENMVVSVVGDIDLETHLLLIRKYFGRLPSGQAPAKPKIVEGEQKGERVVTYRTKAESDLIIAYKKPQYPHPDDAPLSLMVEMLAGGLTSPLYKQLVIDDQMATNVEFQDIPGNAYPNMLAVFITPQDKYSNDQLIKAFDKVFSTFKAKGITKSAMNRARRSIVKDYLYHMRSNRALAIDFASSQALYGDWKTSFNWYEEIMKVSLEDIKRVAEQYIVPAQRTIGKIEPALKE